MPDSLSLAALRSRIARIDSGFGAAAHRPFSTGEADLDAELSGALAEGRLHELFAATVEDAASAAGVALMLSLRVSAGNGALLWLRTEAAERALGQLYMPGLAELGADPGRLVLALLPDDKALLKAAADAAACKGLGALVVECRGRAPLLTLTASRRLALAAEKSGVTLFLLRVDAEPAPSAAATRWSISAAPSQAMTPDAPGHSMIEVELLRRRAGPAGMRRRLEWIGEECAFRKPALPGAVVPLAGDGAVDYRGEPVRRFA